MFFSFLYFHLSTSDRMHSQVRTWTKNVDIFEKDFVVVPINERCVRRKKKNRTGIILAACRTNIKTLSIHQLDGSLVIDCGEAKDLLNFKRLLKKELR